MIALLALCDPSRLAGAVAGEEPACRLKGRKRPSRDPWSERIVAIARDQDRAAFAELFNHFAPRVKAFMRRKGASDAQAEDIAQEAMLAVWRKAALFDPAASGAATWIFTIARNLRIDAIRRENRGGAIRVDEVEAEYEADDAPAADERLAAAQSEARLREALSTLPGEQLKVIEMSFFEEKAHSEIAETLRIPLGTVKSRVRLAMKRLRAVSGIRTMTIEHHPEEAMLAAYAAGVLDLGQRVALATHLHACPRCRAWAARMECVGGELLAERAPARDGARRARAHAGAARRAAAPRPRRRARDGRRAARTARFRQALRLRRVALRRAARRDAADPPARAEPDAGVPAEVGAEHAAPPARPHGARDDLRPARRVPP